MKDKLKLSFCLIVAASILPLLFYVHDTNVILNDIIVLQEEDPSTTTRASSHSSLMAEVNKNSQGIERTLQIASTSSPSAAPSSSSAPSNDEGNNSSLRDIIKRHWKLLTPNNNNNKKQRPLVIQNAIRRQQQQQQSSTTLSSSTNDIVLATHLSPSKFENLRLQLEYWNGPASVGMYMKSLDDIDVFFDFWETMTNQEGDEDTNFLKQTSFHFVLESMTTGLAYPFNTLRQAAMDGVEGDDYFLAIDVDLIPLPRNCHDALVMELFNNNNNNNNTSMMDISNKTKTLFVLPAFSILPPKAKLAATPSMLPKNLMEAMDMIQTGKMEPFHLDYPPAYGPTNYTRWKMEQFHRTNSTTNQNNNNTNKNTNNDSSSSSVYSISLDLKQGVDFEPYVVGYKPSIPRYWEEFRGFGFNKASFLFECYAAGYRYAVLKNFFCAHLDHPTNGMQADDYNTNIQIWKQFMDRISQRYYENDENDHNNAGDKNAASMIHSISNKRLQDWENKKREIQEKGVSWK